MIWISISISFRYFRGICRRQRQFILPKSQWPFPASFLDHAKSREISILRVANSRRRNRFLLRRGVTKKRWAMETIGNSDLVIYYWKVYCKLSVYVLLCLINKPHRAVSIRTVLCTQSPHKKTHKNRNTKSWFDEDLYKTMYIEFQSFTYNLFLLLSIIKWRHILLSLLSNKKIKIVANGRFFFVTTVAAHAL